MSNVQRPEYDAATGQRIRYIDSPVVDRLNRPIYYGMDHSNRSEWDQNTGLPLGVTATVHIEDNRVSAPEEPEEPVTVTRIGDQGYEAIPVFDTASGQTVRQLRATYRDRLNLTTTMIALVDGVTAQDSDVVTEGQAVVFKEPAKRRG